MKTVEELLETGLIQVATKEEELNAIRTENSSLTKEVQDLKAKQNDQVMYLVDPATIFTNRPVTFKHSYSVCLFFPSQHGIC